MWPVSLTTAPDRDGVTDESTRFPNGRVNTCTNPCGVTCPLETLTGVSNPRRSSSPSYGLPSSITERFVRLPTRTSIRSSLDGSAAKRSRVLESGYRRVLVAGPYVRFEYKNPKSIYTLDRMGAGRFEPGNAMSPPLAGPERRLPGSDRLPSLTPFDASPTDCTGGVRPCQWSSYEFTN